MRGYTLANDVTARDLQEKDGQWTRAKGFDTFCPVGPVVSDELDPEAGLILETLVNGELRQHGSTLDFIFPIPKLLAYITAIMTLEAGDLVLTGTPAGVGPLKAGDTRGNHHPRLRRAGQHLPAGGIKRLSRIRCHQLLRRHGFILW